MPARAANQTLLGSHFNTRRKALSTEGEYTMFMSRKRVLGFLAAAAVPVCCAVSMTGTAQADSWGLAQAQAAGVIIDQASALVIANAPAGTCLGDPMMVGCPTVTSITNSDPATTMAVMSPNFDMLSFGANDIAPDDVPANTPVGNNCSIVANPAPYLAGTGLSSSGGAGLVPSAEALSTGRMQCYSSSAKVAGMYIEQRTNQGGLTNEVTAGNVTASSTPTNEFQVQTNSLCSSNTKGTPPYDTLLSGVVIDTGSTQEFTGTTTSSPEHLACNYVNEGSSSGGAPLGVQ